MNIGNYLSLLGRRWREIAVITALVFGLSYLSSAKIVQPSYNATLFMSIGVDRTKNTEGFYGGINAADGFAETMQGWLKDPGVLKEIREAAGDDGLAISARKQERQNVVVTIGGNEDEEAAKSNAESALKVLAARLAEFNERTNNTYALGLSSVTTEVIVPEDQLKITLLIALIFGLVIGVAWAFLYEFLLGRVSFGEQAVGLRGKWRRVFELSQRKVDLDYFKSLLNAGDKKICITVGCDKYVDRKKLGLSGKELLNFPGDLEIETTGYQVWVVVKLGVTNLKDLKNLLEMLDCELNLVVLA